MGRDSISAVRNALASGEFAKAQSLWSDYVEELRQAILRGDATAGDMAEAAALLESARLSALVFRAHSAARLAESRAASLYAQRASSPAPRTRVLL